MAIDLFAARFGSGSCWAKASGTLAIALVLTLAGCKSPEKPTATTPAETSPAVTSGPTPNSNSSGTSEPGETSQVIGEPIVSEHELIPGRHCYAINSETLTGAIGLTVRADDSVVGESQATVHNEVAGYYTGYGQILSGAINKDQLTLDLTSYIEGDVQQAQETWAVGNDQLDNGRDIYEQVDCSVVQEQLDLLGEIIGQTEGAQLEEADAPANDLTEGANFVRVRRLSFAPGATLGRVEDAVVRADRDEYLVGAAAGQTMTLSISALEDNAVFGVVAPDGSVLVDEETTIALELPQSGDYSIVVGGTRGNASYGLEVEIR